MGLFLTKDIFKSEENASYFFMKEFVFDIQKIALLKKPDTNIWFLKDNINDLWLGVRFKHFLNNYKPFEIELN